MLEIFLNDLIKYLLPFLLIINLIGILSFPISNFIFKSNFDRGYINSQILGILGIGWLSFTIGILISQIFGRTYFSFFIPTLIIAFVIWAFLNYKIYQKNKLKNSLSIFIKTNKHILQTILIQIFFLLLIYFSNSFNYTYTPIGTENQMNLAILNTLNYSNKLPPEDMWFAGQNLNYYYFGHYLVAILGNILNLNPSRDFLFLASILPSIFLTAGTVLILTFLKESVSKLNKFKVIIAVFISSLFLLFISPIKTIIPLLDLITGNTNFIEVLKKYPIFSIRVIPDLIIENFNYAILLNPLHALTNNLIVGILILNCLYLLFKSKETLTLSNKYLSATFLLIGFSGLINTWDLIFYLGLTILFVAIFKYEIICKDPKKHLKTLILLLVPIIIILSPWFYFFSSPAGLIGIVTNVSNLANLFYFWGIYIIIFIFFICFKDSNFKNKNFLLFLTISGFTALLFLEIFYFKDALEKTQFYRANSYYKFGNLVLLLFSVSFAAFFSFLIINKKNIIFTYGILVLILLTTWFNYPLLRVKSNELRFTGLLDQSLVVKKFSPELLELIDYLNQVKTPNLVILEGSKNSSYSNSNFVSVFTGIPSVFGWRDHQLTWRNSRELLPEALIREKEVTEIYTSSDSIKTVELIQKYNIDYIVISKSEREIYKADLNEDNLLKSGETVFERNNTKLIKIKKNY